MMHFRETFHHCLRRRSKPEAAANGYRLVPWLAIVTGSAIAAACDLYLPVADLPILRHRILCTTDGVLRLAVPRLSSRTICGCVRLQKPLQIPSLRSCASRNQCGRGWYASHFNAIS